MKNSKIIIKEVDCYRGNASFIAQFATSHSVQHQIMIVEDGTEYFIGRRNRTADDDRGERNVLEIDADPRLLPLMEKAIELNKSMKSEHCQSMEEFNEARIYNAPVYGQINTIIEEMHAIQDLGISRFQFHNHLFY